jgi:hypothetical protein
MNKLNRLIVHSLMNAMYDREPELHPADAYKLASRLINNDETVKNLIIYIVSHQRELLLALAKDVDEAIEDGAPLSLEDIVDIFIANNCG